MNKITLELKSLRQLAERLQSAWVNGDWKAETPNENEMETLMTELGYWPAKIDPNTWELVKPKYNNDEMIDREKVSALQGMSTNRGDEMKMYTHKQFNRLLDENEYNNLPDFLKPLYEFYGIVTSTGGETATIDMNNNNGEENTMNNNPGLTNGKLFGPNTETHTIATPSGQNNTGTYPEPGQIWLHYKGGRYEIIAMCNHTTTNEVMVVYKSKSFNGFHARPYSEWHDEVWEGHHCKTRFTLIGW